MAPPKIDDEPTLLAIAIATIHDPEEKFSEIFRQVISEVPTHQHSDDSARRRIQRKFNRDHDYWISRGHQEIRDRRDEERRRMREQFGKIAENMRRTTEAIASAVEPYRLAIEEMHAKFNSPEMQRVRRLAAQTHERLKQLSLTG